MKFLNSLFILSVVSATHNHGKASHYAVQAPVHQVQTVQQVREIEIINTPVEKVAKVDIPVTHVEEVEVPVTTMKKVEVPVTEVRSVEVPVTTVRKAEIPVRTQTSYNSKVPGAIVIDNQTVQNITPTTVKLGQPMTIRGLNHSKRNHNKNTIIVQPVINEVNTTARVITRPFVETVRPIIQRSVIETVQPVVKRTIVEAPRPVVVEPIVEKVRPVVVEPVVKTVRPVVVEPVVKTVRPVVVEPVVETVRPVVRQPVVDAVRKVAISYPASETTRIASPGLSNDVAYIAEQQFVY